MFEPRIQASEAFDLRRAARLARFAAAAYRSTPAEIAAEVEAESVTVFAAGPAFGFTANLAGELIVAFRGTVRAVEERDQALIQWLANLSFGQVNALGGRVHQGFSEALDLVWDQVRRPVQFAVRSGSRIWLTGHSLGGALAVLAGARLMAESLPVAAVYTFGAPRVGDGAFAAAYRPVLHRVEHANDIVCLVPPPPRLMQPVASLLQALVGQRLDWNLTTDVSYEDAGRLTFIDWDGKLQPEVPVGQRLLRFLRMAFLTSERASLLHDHRIVSYVERLAKAAAQ